jgi:hypothetical protein
MQHDLDCTVEQFWQLYFDPAYTLRLHEDALASTSAEITAQSGDLDGGLTRTVRYGQRPDAPGPVKKLFGDEIISTESSTFDAATSTASLVVTPGTMADKTDIRGTISVEALDGGERCRQTFQLDARVKIFGVGPVVERFIERQARDMQTKSVEYMRRQLAAD